MPCRRVLPALLLAVFCAAAPARAAMITFESVAANPGDAFTLGILVTDVTDLLTFQFDISFNATVLSATGTTEGPLLGSEGGTTIFFPGFLPGEPADDPTPAGLVRMTGGSVFPGPGVSVAPGTAPADLLPLAFVTFLVLASGDANVTLSNILLLNSEGVIEPTVVVNGIVNVLPTTSVPEPATLVLVGLGLLTMARRLRRRT